MNDGNLENTIWYQLDLWAHDFKPWQRFILANAIRFRHLTDEQIGEAYSQFLRDNNISDGPDLQIRIPSTITGRPTSVSKEKIWLKEIKDLHGVNALPSTAELIFSPTLTIVYGRNGAGKSGFTRILSNACFSRTQHRILPNIYDDEVVNESTATITIEDENRNEASLSFDGKTEYEELKRIAIFDTSVAHAHLVEQGPLGFKPTGFDVFPEMARVYSELVNRLEADIGKRRRENTFTKSFAGRNSHISDFVTNLNADTEIEELRSLSGYGEKELARQTEIQNQLVALRSKSPEQTINQLENAKVEILKLQQHLDESQALVIDEKRQIYRTQLADFSEKNNAAVQLGTESFEQDFLKCIGTSEWETFLDAAYKLGQIENTDYPREDDHCLLCHRSLDPDSIVLIRRFWKYLSDDIRRKAEQAGNTLLQSIRELKELRLDFFSSGTIVRDHLSRLNPELAALIDNHLEAIDNERYNIISILENRAGDIQPASFNKVDGHLGTLVEQIDGDLTRFKEMRIEDAIKTLESELLQLQHRQILKQILPDAEKFVNDLKWIKKATGTPRLSLNTQPLTLKEKELFKKVVEVNYMNLFESECINLQCDVPVELHTHGQRGQTVRSLRIKESHNPIEILSEGEQRAVAIADFLTEITLNPANTGIVLDDPVTSLDHQRKELIARRLVSESNKRQVVIFTHDLVFMTMLVDAADKKNVEICMHWIDRDSKGRPGHVSLNDSPTTTPQYRKTTKAQETLKKAKAATGSIRLQLIQHGMGELRRTVEEIIPLHLLKQVVNRWSDRIMVTSLRKVNWNDELVEEIVTAYEDLSAYIEGHSHTEEQIGAPPDLDKLETMITRVDKLIRQVRKERNT